MLKLFFRVVPLFVILFLISEPLDSDEVEELNDERINSPIEGVNSIWVDSLMDNLSLKEKIAQLFMVAVYSNKSAEYEQSTIKLIEDYQVGGLIFMQGGPVRQANLYNKLQEVVKVPLMVGIDGEHGLAMRLDSTVAYPKAMTLGAVENDQLIFEFGQEVARQCNRLGVHINFAPVVDVNSNPKNPIINIRSYGEQVNSVSRKGLAYAMGMQSRNVLAVCKHFPGHGDTKTDSHKTLPTVNHTKDRMDTLEIAPFKHLINNGVGGVMVAHLSVPNLNNGSVKPASLSPNIIDSLLHKQLGFRGLVFTDALNMKGVTRDFAPGEIEVEALLAGNDVLLFPENVEVAIKAVEDAVNNNVIPKQLIEDRCRKVLNAKKWFGLDNFRSIKIESLVNEINSIKSDEVYNKLLQSSITQLGNEQNTIPILNLEKEKVLAISIGQKDYVFHEMLNKYTHVDTIALPGNFNMDLIDELIEKSKAYTKIIVSKHNTVNSYWKKYGVSESDVRLLQSISENKDVVFCYFGNPYGLSHIVDSCNLSSILVGYQDVPAMNSYVAQSVFGGIPILGRLPVSVGSFYKSGDGVKQKNKIRLAYRFKSDNGNTDNVFFKVDSIVHDALEMKATPGCQVWFVKDGIVEFAKNYGNYTYSAENEVVDESIYDLASVTKVVATTLSVMKLYEERKVNVTAKISTYLPEFEIKHKKRIRIDDVMAHQARFHSWIPFYRSTLNENGKPKQELYRPEPINGYEIQVSENLYLRSDYVDSVYQTILDTPIYKTKKYRYSDLGFYWLARLVDKQSGMPINEYVNRTFYSPLGLQNTSYLPLNNFAKERIVPSEKDNYFRHETVQGFVHDPGCAMLGGVSGHAGVFSNGNDMAILGQMLLNKGKYGGTRYLNSETLDVFTRNRFKRKGNRRAMGFDKPAMKITDPGPTCQSASQLSFGHSGFTGTYFWVDPENNSVFVFMSNRTYPSQDNNKLVKHDIRTKIHQAFYDIYQ